MTYKPWLVICFLWSLASCSEPEPVVYQTKILSFGTYVDVTLSGVSKEQADTAITAIEEQLDFMHDQWHAWRPSSITALNEQLQSGKPFVVNDDLLPLVVQSKKLYQSSLGYFNPAIGKLIQTWGFYRDEPQDNKTIPAPEILSTLVKSNPNMDHIKVVGNEVQGFNSDIQIDFGGYAKGYGVEKLIEQLESHEIHNALINAGGDIKGIGGRTNDRAWKIAIEDPFTRQALGWINLKSGESIFSSGDYIRYFEYQGKNYHHIIDPMTGYPSEHARAVTVIATDAALADAAATALMVAPSSDWLAIKEKMGLKHLLIVDRDGTLYSDIGLKDRLTLLSEKTLNNIEHNH